MVSVDLCTTILSSLSCLWIIFKYFQQPKNNIGLLLIFVLALSDLVFALSILTLQISDEETNLQYEVFFFSMQFSILWAAAVSYIVYKSLRDTTLNVMKLFRVILLIVTLLSTVMTVLLNFDWKGQFTFGYLLPLTISLILTFVFYSMSIKILKQQVEYSQISTNIYVRTLRSYSLVQFLTFGPLIIFLMINIFDPRLFEFEKFLFYLGALRTLATLSGFFNTLIFVFQGTGTLKTSANSGADNNLEANLTLDTTSH